MVPKSQSAEFFGFFSTSSKFAGIFGPLIFGLVSQLAGASRLSILSVIIFFIVGGLLLTRVDEEEGRRVAREEDARLGVAEL
jgi:UMF1 family MFS transporter